MEKIAIAIFAVLSFLHCKIEAQVNWEKYSSLEQLKEKAKTQHKLIFIDCMATWCAPCKLMDQKVYTDSAVAKRLNDSFLSVKVQFDSTINDNEQIKKLHALAQQLRGSYNVTAMPTFLFLNQEGKAVHKDVGGKSANSFISILTAASDSNLQYYTLLEKFRTHQIDFRRLPILIEFASQIGDSKEANKVGKYYVEEYLMKRQPIEEISSKQIDFFVYAIERSNDIAFRWLYKNRRKISAIIQDNRKVNNLLESVIDREEVTPRLAKHKLDSTTPNWPQMMNKISKRYGSETADRIVLAAKERWYYNKDWKAYNETIIQRIERYGVDTTNPFSDVYLNNAVWSGIVENSNDTDQIRIALAWMQGVTRRNPSMANYWDTYAHLFFKIGQFDNAISLEQKAVSLDPNSIILKDELEKMIRAKTTKNADK